MRQLSAFMTLPAESGVGTAHITEQTGVQVVGVHDYLAMFGI